MRTLAEQLMVGLMIAFPSILAMPSTVNASDRHIYDITGRYLGISHDNHSSRVIEARALAPTIIASADSGHLEICAGFYPMSNYHIGDCPIDITDEFRFEDVTNEYLPLQVWDAGGVKISDLDGDGRSDIMFTRYTSSYNGVDDYRPRAWIQQSDGRFVDETPARIPDVSAPAFEPWLFDAEGDGDVDIFLPGYSISNYFLPAALFINDGTGHFSDQSSGRLPLLPNGNFVYWADPTDVNGDNAMDVITTIWDMTSDNLPILPQLWLNNGSGVFEIDTLGRLPVGEYGYFMPIARDIDNDSRADIIFANIELIITDEIGRPIDTLSGQNTCCHNLGNGFFADETDLRMPLDLNPDTRDIAFADVNGDGNGDMLEVAFVGGDAPQVRLLANNGAGVFSVVPGAIPDEVAGWFNNSEFGRLSDDGLPDLFMIRVMPGLPDYDMLLVNGGQGVFADSSQLLPLILDFSVSCALFDHEIDNDLDLCMANTGGNPPNDDTVGQNLLYHNLLNSVDIDDDGMSVPAAFSLRPSYPNPFNSSAVISYTLASAGKATLAVYDIIGHKLTTLVEGKQEAGNHRVIWKPKDIPSGVYFARMSVRELSVVTRMVLVK